MRSARGRWRPLLGVAFGLVAFGMTGCGDASLGDRLDLTGTVTNTETGRGVGGAQVRFVSDTGLVRETSTSSDGGYGLALFSDTPFGQLRVEAEGFQPREATVFFDTPRRVVDVELRPSGE